MAAETQRRVPAWEAELSQQVADLRSLGGSESNRGAVWEVRCYDSLESTMDAAKCGDFLGVINPGHPGVVLAGQQRSGRGRQGRTWISADQGVYVTFVFSLESPVYSLSGYSLVVGTVVCAVLKSLGCEVGLKWPNDLLSIDGKKLCGILMEILKEGSNTYVLTGIGINLCLLAQSSL